MTKRAKPLLLILGMIFSLLAGIVIGRALRYRHPSVEASVLSFPEQKTRTVSEGDAVEASPIPLLGETPVVVAPDVPELDVTSQWMKFGGLELLAGEVSFHFETGCDDGEGVVIPPVKIVNWHSEVFEDGEFGIGKNVAVAWEHLGYEGLWIHSGWDFWSERSPATDLQYFIETDPVNEVQPLETIESRLDGCLRGNQVSLEQQGRSFEGKVAAAARVPAVGVEELSKHTMDLVPYLAQAYPQSGFAELNEDALLIYFCGRAALDERTDPDAGYWTQTRYIIAVEPEH